MYHSHLLINVGDNPDRPNWRIARRWLRNLYRVHQRLCMAFPTAARKCDDPDFLAPYQLEHFPEQRHLADRLKRNGRRFAALKANLAEQPPFDDQLAGAVEEAVLKDVHAPRDANRGFLFRIDPQPGGSPVILVQSALMPDWDYAFHNAGHLLAAAPQVKVCDPVFTADERLRFRLAANPTKKVDTKTRPDGARRNGKRVAVHSNQLEDWLTRRAASAGFAIEADSLIMQPGYVYVNKTRNGKGRRLRSVRYEGRLRVLDADDFREALFRGIGPAKAFGFGLLSVGRAG